MTTTDDDAMMPIKTVVAGLANEAKILSYFVIRQTIGSADMSLECTECLWRLNVSMEPTPLVKLVNEANEHFQQCDGSPFPEGLNHDKKTGSATD